MNLAGGTLDASLATRIGKTIIPLEGMRSNCNLLFETIRLVDNNINTLIHPSGVLAHNDVHLTLFFSLTTCIQQQCSALNPQQQKLQRL